jgi:hypothetical protein
MATFKFNLEDKAAFLNRMEKAGVALDTDQIVDNKLESYFEVTIDNPKQLEALKTILKQSPKINNIKMNSNKKLSAKDLKEMIRQELSSYLNEADQEKKVTITLDEIMQAGSAEYEVGQWVMNNYPTIADLLKSTSVDPDQQIADLGGQVITLATVGTVAISAGLVVAKDKLVDAAKKLKNAARSLMGGGMKEGDDGLQNIVRKIPKDVLAKLAK